MEKVFSDIAIGVIGGFIATFLTLVVRKYWLSIILPWYEERIYQDAHFEGVWEVTETYTTEQRTGKYIMEIHRQGHHVEGTLTGVDGHDSGHVYLLDGSFRNLILTLNWIPREKTKLDRGAWVLKLKENGNKFVGFGGYYSTKTEEVLSCEVVANIKNHLGV